MGSLKAMAIMHLYISEHSNRKLVINFSPFVSATRFGRTHFYSPYQFHVNTKPNHNIKQNFPLTESQPFFKSIIS